MEKGKRHQVVHNSFPQMGLAAPEVPDGESPNRVSANNFGYTPTDVQALKGMMLCNAVESTEPADGPRLLGEAFNLAALGSGRTESAEASKVYWGFTNVRSANLDYFGADNSYVIPDKSQVPIVVHDTAAGGHYFLPNPFQPNLYVPWSPASLNTAGLISLQEANNGDQIEIDADGNEQHIEGVSSNTARAQTLQPENPQWNPRENSNFIGANMGSHGTGPRFSNLLEKGKSNVGSFSFNG